MQSIKTKRKYNRLLIPRGKYYAPGGLIGKLNDSISKNPLTGVAVTSGAGILGQLGNSAISGSLQSGVGSAISGIGNAVGDIAQVIPGLGPLAGAAIKISSGLVGGLTNRMFGSKLNKENISNVEGQINQLNAFQSNASDFDSLIGNWSDAPTMSGFSNKYIGKDGWFSNKAKNKANALRADMQSALAFRDATLMNNTENIINEQANNLLANYNAYGGHLFSKGGGIHIKPENRGKFNALKKRTGKTTEELTHSKNPLTRKRAIFAQNAKKWHHAFGGELGTNGADFSNGIIEINSGGTHEQNPNEGVIFGIDQEGIPNLVEEGEVVFGDYVYSNRIKVPKTVIKRHRLTDGITFADAAKELAKESEERPNDPISQNGLEYLMNDLMIEQEMVKAKRENNKFSKGGGVNKYEGGTPNMDRILFNTSEDWMGNPNKGKSNKTPLNIADLRYLPALGSMGSVITDALGITNKPDYEAADTILAASRGLRSPSIRFSPIGNYLTYKPLDRNYYMNTLNAQAGASRRALSNSGISPQARAAAILAGDNNYINQIGSFARQAEEYNLAQRQQVENFNRGTNQYNSEGALKASIADAENRIKVSNLMMNSLITGAKMRQDARYAAEAAKSANLTNMLDNIGNIGWEEYNRNGIPSYLGYTRDRVGNVPYTGRFKKGGYLTIKRKRK